MSEYLLHNGGGSAGAGTSLDMYVYYDGNLNGVFKLDDRGKPKFLTAVNGVGTTGTVWAVFANTQTGGGTAVQISPNTRYSVSNLFSGEYEYISVRFQGNTAYGVAGSYKLEW